MTENKSSQPITDRGSIAVITALSFIPIAIALAVLVDSGRAWEARHRLQNGVEVAAAAAAQSWMSGGGSCSATSLALVTADGATAPSISCSVTGTNTNGTVTVSASSRVPLAFASLIGRDFANVSASTGVRIGPASSAIGVSPLSLCANNPDISAWIASGMTSRVTATITFETATPVCGGTIPGNWGTLDFNGGNNSTTELADWVVNGYEGSLNVGDVIDGNPGAPSTSSNIAAVVGESFIIALYSAPYGSGSSAKYPIVGFAQVHLVSANVTATASKRSLTVRFERGITSGSVGDLVGNNGIGYGVSTWSVCAYDSQGECS